MMDHFSHKYSKKTIIMALLSNLTSTYAKRHNITSHHQLLRPSCCFIHQHYASTSSVMTTRKSDRCSRPASFFPSRNVKHFSTSPSTFEAPDPPSFSGQPVFPNIDLGHSSSPHQQSINRNADPKAVYVITGASRGIGLQMVKSLVERTKGTIIACCRTPSNALELNSFINETKQNSNIVTHTLDLENQESIQELAQFIHEKYNRVDLLLNVAGILGDGSTTPGPERSIKNLDRDWTIKTFNVNYLGPVFLSQALAPMMRSNYNKRSSAKNNDQDDRPASVIANLSARVGSISDNGLGGWISYRSSKAALNQATRTMALELKRQGTWTISLHPGTTDTDLSKPFQRNVKDGRLFPVEFTVDRLLNVIDRMDEKHSGGFFDWSGTALPF